jgi:tetratricopeptide (TPR) repeat protein
VLIVAGLAAYGSSFSGVFIGDDFDAIVLNDNLHSLWPPTTAMTAPADTTLAGRPIATWTFALNYALAPARVRKIMEPAPGLSPDDPFYENIWGYHALNLLIHLLSGLALFGIVRRTLNVPVLRDRFGRASSSLAFAVALLWLVHPLHTDSVTFLVQRVESLMGLWVLTTMYCAIRAAESDFESRPWMAAAVAACALGMGTKEVTFAAPILVAVWIYLCRPDVRLTGSPRWLLVGLASTWIVLAFLLTRNSRSLSVGFLGGWTWWLYLRTQAEVIVHYLRLVFWPRPLAFDYAWLPAATWTQVLPQFLLLGALGIATVFALVRCRPIAFLGVWFFLILAPSSSILPIASEVAAEHRMYLPLAALMTLIVLGAYAGVERITGPAQTAASVRKRWAPAAWIAVAVIGAALAWETSNRNLAYASVGIMMQDNAIARPGNASVQLLHGSQLVLRHQFAEAEAVLRRAVDLPWPPGTDPQPRALIHVYFGAALCGQGKFDEGIAQLRLAITIMPDLMDSYGFIAEAYLTQGKAHEAVLTLELAIARRPDDTTVLKRAAWVMATSSNAAARNGTRALELAERAVARTERRDPLALDTLAAAYAETGQFDRAIAAVRQSIDLMPPSESGLGAMLRGHLGLFEVRRPVRSAQW